MRRALLLSMAVLCAGLAPLACEDIGTSGDDTADDFCPDPTDPCVDYASEDPDECAVLDFSCGAEEVGFSGACGCGCLAACRR